MRHGSVIIWLLLPLILSSFAATDTTGGEATAEKFVKPAIFERVEEFRLDNGMLFLLLPRPELPTVSGRIRVRVGNVDNPVGQTGLAHMFEHMAFKGTDRIGTTDHPAELAVQESVAVVGAALAREVGRRRRGDPELVESLEAELARLSESQARFVVPMEFPRVYDGYTIDFNASTSVDFTDYYTDVPANNLEVWMLMESERIQHPSFREFYAERDVVMEERRQRTEDNPEGAAWELLYSLAFSAHPYRFPTIGYMSDLETLTQDQAEAFRRVYYVPGNMVAALVGDFDPEDAKRMIVDYFGDIPAGPDPPEVTTEEPEPLGMRRGTVRKGTERGVFICFPSYDPTDRRAIVAAFLSSLLTRDNTSRLKRRLEIDRQVVRRVASHPTGGYRRYPGVFEIEAHPNEESTNEQVEALIWEELGRLLEDPITDEKVDELRRGYRKSYYYGLETNRQLAGELITQESVLGDWRRTYEKFADYETVTAGEIMELARELFDRDRATVVYLEPEADETPTDDGGES